MLDARLHEPGGLRKEPFRRPRHLLQPHAPPPLDKGETSGNYLDIVSVTADCDNDTLLIRAIPHGPTCHTGAGELLRRGPRPGRKASSAICGGVIKGDTPRCPRAPYTSKLFDRGVNKIAQKVGEEAVETVIEAVAGNREAMIYEASDLIYHLLVLLEATGCSIANPKRSWRVATAEKRHTAREQNEHEPHGAAHGKGRHVFRHAGPFTMPPSNGRQHAVT